MVEGGERVILFFLFSFIGRKKEGGYPVMGFDFSLGGFTSFSASLYFPLFPVSFVYFLSIFQLLSFLFLSLPVFLYFCLSDCLSVCLSFSLFPCFSPSSLPFFPHFLLVSFLKAVRSLRRLSRPAGEEAQSDDVKASQC